MTENEPAFQIVANGYDPDEVDRRIAELVQATKIAQQHAHELHLRLEEQQQERENFASPPTDSDQDAEPDFTGLGDHIANLIKAAHETAVAIRSDSQAEAKSSRAKGERLVSAARAEADAVMAAANQQVAVASRHRDEIIKALTDLRDRLPAVLGPVASQSDEGANDPSAPAR